MNGPLDWVPLYKVNDPEQRGNDSAEYLALRKIRRRNEAGVLVDNLLGEVTYPITNGITHVRSTRWRDADSPQVSLDFSYDEDGTLTQMATADGRVRNLTWTYEYTGDSTAENLQAWDNGCGTCSSYVYEYENALLTRVVDTRTGASLHVYEYGPGFSSSQVVTKYYRQASQGDPELLAAAVYSDTAPFRVTQYSYSSNTTSKAVVQEFSGDEAPESATRILLFSEVNPDLGADANTYTYNYEFDGNETLTRQSTAHPRGNQLTEYFATSGPDSGQVTKRGHSNGSAQIVVSEFAHAVYGGQTQITSYTDIRMAETTYLYDLAGLLTQERAPAVSLHGGSAVTQTMRYEYDKRLRLTKERRLGPSGQFVDTINRYDTADNLTQAIENFNGTPTLATQHAYDGANRITLTVDSRGVSHVSEYSDGGQPPLSTLRTRRCRRRAVPGLRVRFRVSEHARQGSVRRNSSAACNARYC